MKIKKPMRPKAPLLLQPGDIIEINSAEGPSPHVVFSIHGRANLEKVDKRFGILNIKEGYTHVNFFYTLRELTNYVLEKGDWEIIQKDKHDFTLLVEEKVEL